MGRRFACVFECRGFSVTQSMHPNPITISCSVFAAIRDGTAFANCGWNPSISNAIHRSPQIFGLALFLGSLYHLRLLTTALEKLAFMRAIDILEHAHGRLKPRHTVIEPEPLVYLLAPLENNDRSKPFLDFLETATTPVLTEPDWDISITNHRC